MEPVPSTPTAIEFGRFRVLPHRREVLAAGRPTELGGRGFDVLMALIEALWMTRSLWVTLCRLASYWR